ncbi:VWA domain-containing protein [Myroides marinus]|uniref:VWA domain-containing protein n=1 Tax=Myroides marinus TaxID=703342 RepID=UPI0025760997|nr:VWA domain-containing protein [Myroides marinus]MDM1367413.1 VWA domain-containing protein [Myroides marinus]MDM1370995.1 VWA domain-containing protein [Myroides marinus]MDM1373912.1 VWA domain-containing protein [Myroides marinus]MDM1382934.1 VWA domain-containing protein [Myroides marinus]MDM1388385.1 VWA domain-containing protein [Myroides marinus]
MWELDNKKYLFLLLVVAVLVLVFVANMLWKKKKQQSFATYKAMKALAPNRSKNKPIIKATIYLLALASIVIALVNPKIGTKVVTVKRQGVDIVFTLDVSKSMLAQDMAPDRLSKMKQLVSQIINNLGPDRIGIVGYAGTAFPMLPITTDHYVAKMYLQTMNTDMVSSQGTAFEDAIYVASNFYDNPNTSKVMILISDGEDHGEEMDSAIKIAKEKKVKIITIGVGTETGGPIPIKTAKGTEYKRDWDNEIVTTKLNPSTLKHIADATGGKYYYGSNTQEIVDLIKNDLSKIEKTDFEDQQIAEYQAQYQWFLGFAFLLIFIDLFILERKTIWMKKLNLFNEKE